MAVPSASSWQELDPNIASRLLNSRDSTLSHQHCGLETCPSALMTTRYTRHSVNLEALYPYVWSLTAKLAELRGLVILSLPTPDQLKRPCK